MIKLPPALILAVIILLRPVALFHSVLTPRTVLLRLLLLWLALSALPAVAVQNVQGILASPEQSFEAALEQRTAACFRQIWADSRDERLDDSSSDSAALPSLWVTITPAGYQPVCIPPAVPLTAIERRLPPAQAPPYA
ncbi:hypothetical protein GJQ55_02010 [Venatoribacter cucullus]|uniref:Uncharacterized protein n=1 Tax=Venatoribacter cucullus TaxID=2661630 RepID=A0A9X7YN33_9GAMM|nr:hypothetical protein [Venatoribacter cucullus]QQD20617.1 hypothetical protein GJQ54_02035 [Oceanospirillaceae bacterium ASx5O]QQD23324.1 hypothetical protein GJQ55_02010 [Venatoribacter cucullus]